MPTRRLLIYGRVQGVGFRASLASEAERLGLTGWVRNRRDGAVEAVVSGGEPDLSKLIEWAHRGPISARVTGVDVTEAAGEYVRFELRPTA